MIYIVWRTDESGHMVESEEFESEKEAMELYRRWVDVHGAPLVGISTRRG